MQSRRLGWAGLNLSVIGLGTWAIGGSGWRDGWGPQNDRDSISAIRRALELGINWVDTAPVYGLGHSEEVVGEALRELKNKPIIATKCGLAWDKDGEISVYLEKKGIRSEIEASLKRLKVDAIDLYQIHWPSGDDEEIEEAWSTIADLIKKGEIRYGGVSNFNVEQLRRIQLIHPVASLQPPYSMLERGIEDGLLEYCSKEDIGVVVYSPMQQGLLTGKFTKERVKNLPQDDYRRKNSHFQEPKLTANLKLVKGLRSIAEKKSITIAQLAIAWVLRRPEVTAAIVGTRRPSQIEETASAGDWMLSEEDITAINRLLGEHKKQLNHTH